jgi:hypothetical protein
MTVEEQGLSDFTMIGFEQAAEPLDADNLAVITFIFWVDAFMDSLIISEVGFERTKKSLVSYLLTRLYV